MRNYRINRYSMCFQMANSIRFNDKVTAHPTSVSTGSMIREAVKKILDLTCGGHVHAHKKQNICFDRALWHECLLLLIHHIRSVEQLEGS
ncbi:uncharacterized protein PHALS_10128 [Plasmopara halstedii]|uniref:Uncharacterized protein n=1 Tax=Plasmopara halstedii TaxID=4781 RepID=A0A0P1AGD5_PLAHL|nr:uncharacterized protein PHALS_10128 [Plasmopara halstedii]CEG39900.1 hypothetical protein PHALS_10128 [Plasmopara halstedii]|eukprot:XP_024576269.1 hypothetical protein PHALS_10128 [Plasmopara halstedii]